MAPLAVSAALTKAKDAAARAVPCAAALWSAGTRDFLKAAATAESGSGCGGGCSGGGGGTSGGGAGGGGGGRSMAATAMLADVHLGVERDLDGARTALLAAAPLLCTLLDGGGSGSGWDGSGGIVGKGLHSSTFQLNLSRFLH